MRKIHELRKEAGGIQDKHVKELRSLREVDTGENDPASSFQLLLLLADTYDFEGWVKIACLLDSQVEEVPEHLR